MIFIFFLLFIINIEDDLHHDSPLIYPLVLSIINYSNNILNTIGLGFIENIYHKALLVDLYKNNHLYDIETKKILPIIYNNINIGYVEPDIIIQNNTHYIIIELKAFDKNITSKEILQINKYINHTNTNKNIIGIIINFNQNINNIQKKTIDYKIIE